MNSKTYDIDCTGDVVQGDKIMFTEAVFGGSHRKPKFLGERTIKASILKDSYGAAKQQHTFTLRVIASEGLDPIDSGERILRKGRNIYKNFCLRKRWEYEDDRKRIADEKHVRGSVARVTRSNRINIA